MNMKIIGTVNALLLSVGVEASQLFNCPEGDAQAVLACSEACTKSEFEISFMPDKERSVVLLKKTKQGSSWKYGYVLEDCYVFDERNWVCTEVKSRPERNSTWTIRHKMVDGSYQVIDRHVQYPSALDPNRYDWHSGTCTK